ncbi:acyltransferase family protein [Paraburkholderia sp. UCT70]|uniref:acyltransferase family protein n=1 Tax=Paraburkholderia sp. UCT70 TaxID=2991068 RepID=UPI003D1B9DC9
MLEATRGLAAVTIAVSRITLERPPLQYAYLALDLMFCISGFLVARAYGEALLTGTLDCRDVTLRRFMRIYPSYALGIVSGAIALVGPAILTNTRDFALVIAAQLLFIPIPGHYLFPFDTPVWSLAAELIACFAFACGGYRVRTTGLALLVAVAFAILARWACIHGTLNAGWGWQAWPIGFLRTAFSFGLGVILARYVTTMPEPTGVFRRCLLATGSIAYPVYVLVIPVAFLTAKLWPAHNIRPHTATTLAAAIAVLYVAAYYREVEELSAAPAPAEETTASAP